MKIAIVAVGRLRDPGLRGAIETYYKRISRYAMLDEIEIREEGRANDIDRLIERRIPKGAISVALAVDGKSLSSPEFARFIEDCERQARPLAFVIGGAYGLSDSFCASVTHRLALSSMTFPHRLARLMLAEQIYRAYTISRGTPYAH